MLKQKFYFVPASKRASTTVLTCLVIMASAKPVVDLTLPDEVTCC
jgi:hypothetical protein